MTNHNYFYQNSANATNNTTNNQQQATQEPVTSPKENNITHNTKSVGNNRDKVYLIILID